MSILALWNYFWHHDKVEHCNKEFQCHHGTQIALWIFDMSTVDFQRLLTLNPSFGITNASRIQTSNSGLIDSKSFHRLLSSTHHSPSLKLMHFTAYNCEEFLPLWLFCSHGGGFTSFSEESFAIQIILRHCTKKVWKETCPGKGWTPYFHSDWKSSPIQASSLWLKNDKAEDVVFDKWTRKEDLQAHKAVTQQAFQCLVRWWYISFSGLLPTRVVLYIFNADEAEEKKHHLHTANWVNLDIRCELKHRAALV